MCKLSSRLIKGRFGSCVLDGFGAPQLSKLTECGAPEMENAENYLKSFVLNGLFRAKHSKKINKFILMFGRRADNAVKEYREGRDFLLSYVQRLPQGNDHFLQAFCAVTHFEQCIGSAYMACTFQRCLMSLLEEMFQIDKCDANKDVEDRLKDIWNRAKHFDEDIAGDKIANDLIAPVWLTNTGISATERPPKNPMERPPKNSIQTVTWEELHKIITEQQTYLRFLAIDLPNKFAEEINQTEKHKL
ncbi:hypothetical protein [Rhodospirillum rubrum]|uniref:hypothetical protein n=1 Tax=Rhodospirillum rubrum TaxID=1085 RepID=UPI001903BF08|nr:hypothetical protein [Rhodospirillum rubrum]